MVLDKAEIKQAEHIGQLIDLSLSESKYAADNCQADWYDQAERSAENYLSFMAFSKSGLIQQLEYSGFTKEEAEYGAAAAYNENPKKPNSSIIAQKREPVSTAVPTEMPKETPEPRLLAKNDVAFDLSGLSYEELCALQEQVNQALWASDHHWVKTPGIN